MMDIYSLTIISDAFELCLFYSCTIVMCYEHCWARVAFQRYGKRTI